MASKPLGHRQPSNPGQWKDLVGETIRQGRRSQGDTGSTTMWCMNNRSLTIRLDEALEQGLEAACAETG
ncbi:MAG: hypothetical protein ACKO58_03860, partial [Cyanobium sp.]